MTWEITPPGPAQWDRAAQDLRRSGPARRVGVAVLSLVFAAMVTIAPAASAQSSASVSVAGSQITVDVSGIPGHQVRAELEDGTIASTALITPTGTTQMVFELPPGSYQIEVITFDPTGIPTSAGTYPATVAGPPPPAPGVEITAGSSQDNRTIARITGPAATAFEIEIVREGETATRESGTLADDGTASAVFLLESGPWGYIATLSNGSGDSPSTLGEFTVEIGAPAPPTLTLLTSQGQNPVKLGIAGPASGSVEVTASLGDEDVTKSTGLDEAGAAEVELDLPDSGTWEVTAVAIDFADQRSEPATIEGGVEVIGEGPPLELDLLSAGEGEFRFSVTTSIGTLVTVDGTEETLQFEFTAEEETTEFTIEVTGPDPGIEVTATDEFGNRSVDTLSSTSSGGGGVPWSVLGVIIAGLLLALGAFGFLRRQELMDWWNTRQYH